MEHKTTDLEYSKLCMSFWVEKKQIENLNSDQLEKVNKVLDKLNSLKTRFYPLLFYFCTISIIVTLILLLVILAIKSMYILVPLIIFGAITVVFFIGAITMWGFFRSQVILVCQKNEFELIRIANKFEESENFSKTVLVRLFHSEFVESSAQLPVIPGKLEMKDNHSSIVVTFEPTNGMEANIEKSHLKIIDFMNVSAISVRSDKVGIFDETSFRKLQLPIRNQFDTVQPIPVQ